MSAVSEESAVKAMLKFGEELGGHTGAAVTGTIAALIANDPDLAQRGVAALRALADRLQAMVDRVRNVGQ